MAPPRKNRDLPPESRGVKRPRTKSYEVKPGQHVSGKGGRIRVIETETGNVIQDFGEFGKRDGGEEPASRPTDQEPPGIPDNAWIEDTAWQNTTGQPVVYFSSTWVVPEPPDSNDNQEIYLFNGLTQTSTGPWILQPVLQWGVTPDGGGPYWAIANWYVPAPSLGLQSLKTSLIQVNPGDVLQGVMTCTSQTGSEFSYVSSFAGHSSIDLTVTDVDELQWAFETLECYGLTQCSDYPASVLTAFYDIEIKTGTPGTSGTDTTVSWQAQTNFTDCGQNCIVVSNDSPGGAVYLYYDQPATRFYFVNDKSSFGKDEVSDTITDHGGVFSAAFYLALEGFTLQQLTIDLPKLVSPGTGGPFETLTGVTISPSAAYQPFYDPANLYTPQRILYPFDITFDQFSLADFPATGSIAELLTASITVGSAALGTEQILTADTVITLVAGADPYFSNVDPQQDNAYYLSQDVRVFTISPQSDGPTSIDNLPFTFQTGGPTALDTAAAYDYIQQLITHFNNTYHDPSGVDPFDLNHPKLPAQGDVYGGDSTVTPVTIESLFPLKYSLNYNFALARVRMSGSPGVSGEAANVRVFFRLFTTQTFDTDYINIPSAVSAGDPNVTYPSLPASQPDAPTSPLPGTDSSGTINGSSLPYFAAADQSDLAAGGVNNTTIVIPAGQDATWTYFGCFLNVYDPNYLIGGQDSQHWLIGASHSCLIAQIAYPGIPIENSNGVIESPENCVQLAQRNLQITLSGNPGFPSTHLIPQTFDTRPSPPPSGPSLYQYPDELMIDWRNTPAGSTAEIYWPAVNSADVLALAAQLYSVSSLGAVDSHTLSCSVGPGMTYVPIPAGGSESFAGLITVQLPVGIHTGDEFDIVIRRITSRRLQNVVLRDRKGDEILDWRYVVGTFQMNIPVQRDDSILPGEENLLAILRWRLQSITPQNRWYPVLERYIAVVAKRVAGLGGHPNQIVPSPIGTAGQPKYLPSPPVKHHHHDLEFTGKVTGVRYSRFGDFEGFDLRTESGAERSFRAAEPEIEELVVAAWRDRILMSVFVHHHHREWPTSIVLRRPPRRPRDPW